MALIDYIRVHDYIGPPSNRSWKPFAFVTLLTILPVSALALHYFSEPWRLSNPSYSGLALFLATYLYLVRSITIPYFCSPLRDLPSPPGVSFWFAHGAPVLAQPPGENLLRMALSVVNNGLIFFRGPFHKNERLLVRTPEAFGEVMTRAYDYAKPSFTRGFIKLLIGEGLVYAEGNMHKVQRKSVNPAFHSKHIRALVPVFWGKSRVLVDCLGEQLKKTTGGYRQGVIELDSWACLATLDIIGLACVGRDFDSLHEHTDPLATAFSDAMNPDQGNIVLYFAACAFLPLSIINILPWPTSKMIQRVSATLKRVGHDLVRERHEELAKEEEGAQDDSTRRKDLLSVLMRSSTKFSDDSLVDQLLTMFAAGHDTTSHATSWGAYLLATHPIIQSKLRAEILQNVSPTVSPADIDAAHIDALPYLQAVISEVLRLYPSVPLTAREAIRDTQLLGNVVPKGTMVIACPWLINRHPEVWEDADQFKPERWMAGGSTNEKSKDPVTYGGASSAYAFGTFLHDARSCVGQQFARYELKCLIAALVGKFYLEMRTPGEMAIPAGALTIKPKGGLYLKLTEV